LAECLKYVNHPNNVPKDQESQLGFLLDQYKTNDVRTAFCQLIGKVGGLATTAFSSSSLSKESTYQMLSIIDLQHQIYVG
jgi:hypothetical protein